MANNGTEIEDEMESLSKIFKEGLDLYNNLGKSDEPTNSLPVQTNIKRAMKIFEKATRLVSLAGIFSSNEGIEELPTNDLQFFLLPAFLGSLVLKLTSGERKEIVDVAEVYFKDFLKRCNEYGLSNYEFKDKCASNDNNKFSEKSDFEKLAHSVNTRANKIQRYKEQKELKAHLEDLKKNMENEHADEEIKRNYFLTMIKLFIHESIDELSSIDMEKPILEHIATLKKDDNTKPEQKRLPPPPLKPIIITKDEIQKAVYGAGYPSLPIMTVQEFYDKRVADGVFPDPNKKPSGPLSLQQAALAGVSLNTEDKEDEDKEEKIDTDDPEMIERMRRMDDYKDEHRRGWGNRMNRS